MKRRPANSIFDWEDFFFFSFEGTDESNCVFHSAVTKQTVISLSGNLVSSASDITDECDVRLEGVEGRRRRRWGVSHSLPNAIM